MSGGALERLVDALLARSPLQPLFASRQRSLSVLAYHRVEDPLRFEAHLDHLAKAWSVISLEQALEAMRGGADLPQRAVLVTFDDADRGLLEDGLPLLLERGMPAVAFVIAGLLGTARPPWFLEVEHLVASGGRLPGLPASAGRDLVRHMKTVPEVERLRLLDALRASAATPAPPFPQLTPAELSALEAGGLAVASHGTTHPCLPRCDDLQARREVVEAHEILARALSHPPAPVFAYPNGDADPRAEEALAGLGYRLGVLFDHRRSPWPPPRPFRVSRLRVNSDTSLDRFRIILSGLHPALHRARGGR